VVSTTNNNQNLAGIQVISLASDGKSHHRKALANLTFVAPLALSLPIYDQLIYLDLMNYYVGPDDITTNKDYKYVFKWLCNAILHENGCVVCSVHITCALIHKHFKDSRITDAHISHVLDPTDKQDVVLVYSLLKDLRLLSPADTASSTPTYIKACEALYIYGDLSYHLMFPYICTKLLLSKQLKHLSAAMHLILALYVLDDA
jgi:hypothetical protein